MKNADTDMILQNKDDMLPAEKADTLPEENADMSPEEKAAQFVGNVAPEPNKMGTGSIGKLLASMSWPAILSMTIGALYNMVDSMFVSRLPAGPKALTAVSLIMPIQTLMISVAVGSGVGVNSLIARRLGAKRYGEANQAASTSIFISILNGLIFLALGLLFAKPFVYSYTDDPVIRSYAVQYFRIVTMLSIFFMVECELEKVLQATGNMIAPMLAASLGGITNIVLDPIFIFGLFGMPRLEVAGAAVATVMGQLAAMLLAVYIAFTKNHRVKFEIKGFKVDWNVVKDIYAVGLPSIVMQSIESVMLIGYNKILADSSDAVAVLGVYYKLQSFVFMPVFGLNQGAMPLMGYNYGAHNKARLMKTYKVGLIAAVVMMAAGFIVFEAIPGKLMGLFNSDAEMMAIGVPALKIISLCFLPAAFGIISSTLFQATGHGIYSLFCSSVRQLVGILPIAYILYHTMGLEASWFSFPIAEVIGFIFSLIMVIYLYRHEIKYL